MLKFKNFIKDYRRKYVCVKFTDDTILNLTKYCSDNGFDISVGHSPDSKFYFHCTVFYSETTHIMKNESYSISNLKLVPMGLDLFGKEKNIPVLKLTEGPLSSIRETFEKVGMRDAWDQYRPHITLSYNYSGTPDISKVDLPTFDIIANVIVIEDIEE